jgi:sugar/nucleoside kinase (ribokinase family)
MRVLDADEAVRLYELMGPARETSGGSAANSVAGLAALGGRAGFVGQVARDQLGTIFSHDLRSLGVEFRTLALSGDVPTGRCLILVTPDAQRTMNTFPGASHYLSPAALDPRQISETNILYLEAYLWRSDSSRAAMLRAMEIARSWGRTIAFTLSDIACISRHRDEFRSLVEQGTIDILFANEEEAMALTGTNGWEAALAALEGQVPLTIITRSQRGAVASDQGMRVDVPAHPVVHVVDTTGAGDLFAAGFLFGRVRGRSVEESLGIATLAASEVISHFGARPQADLKAMVGL